MMFKQLPLSLLIFCMACWPGGEGTGTQSSSSTSENGTSDSSSKLPECNPEPQGECDLWCPMCGKGQKCVPVAVGSGGYDSTLCSVLKPVLKGVGEVCYMNSVAEGDDDCDEGLVCLGWDLETKQGVCAPLCQGSSSAPVCVNASQRCVIGSEGVLPLCLDVCDPLTQENCDGFHSCYAVDSVCPECFPMVETGTFACLLDSGGESDEKSPCGHDQRMCKPGLFCALESLVPGCPVGSEGCCTPYCNVNLPSCSGETVCTNIFEESAGPKGMGHIGACIK